MFCFFCPPNLYNNTSLKIAYRFDRLLSFKYLLSNKILISEIDDLVNLSSQPPRILNFLEYFLLGNQREVLIELERERIAKTNILKIDLDEKIKNY